MTEIEIPFSHDQEAMFLGAIFMRNDLMQYLEFLKPEDFHSQVHVDVYSAMVKLHNNAEEINPFTVPKYIENIKIFDLTGGINKYFGTILGMGAVISGTPISVAQSIKKMSVRRKLIEFLSDKALEISLNNDPKDITQHLTELRDVIERIGPSEQLDLFIDNHRVMEDLLKEMKNPKSFFPTGFDKLDEAMGGGLYPGKTYGIAARKKVGKTAMAATISANLNQNKVDHLFICGEMSAIEIQQRILSRYADIYPSSFRSGYGKSDDCHNRIAAAIPMIPRHTFFQNAAGMTFSSLKRACRIAVERKKVKGIIIDYWQLVGGKQKGQSTSEHLDEVAQWIADFSRQHDIFSITMAQINQEGNTRGSEGIRLAFDQVYQLHRDDLAQPQAWVEMLETRYTKWINIGDKIKPGFMLNEKGPYFEAFS